MLAGHAMGTEPDSLTLEAFDMNQVVVTATRTEKKLKDSPVITQVITAKQIEERGLTSIQDLLVQEVPGLNFQEVGYGTDIDIQGLGAKHVLFLVDGERLAGENSGNIDYSRISLANVERIEIVKGASSALYGSQAMGGVINIITREAQQKVEASAGIKYGSLYQRNYEGTPKTHQQYKYRTHLDKPNLSTNAGLGLNLGRLTMNTDVAYKSQDAYQLDGTGLSGIEDVQVSHKMNYRLSDRVKLRGYGKYYLLNKYDFTADNVYDRSQDYTYGAAADVKLSEGQTLTASLHADHYSRYDQYELKSGHKLDYRNNILQPRLAYANTALKKQTLTAGLEFFRETLYSDKFEADVYQTKAQWYATAFAQDDWSLSKKLSLIGGLRADVHKEYGANITPKASVMYKLWPFNLRLNYARGYRSPTLKELYMNWDHLGMFWIYGNSALKPETNNYLSLSVEYTCRWLNISVNGYGNWFRNKIEGVWANNETEYHYTNIGRAQLAGVEVMGMITAGKYVNIHGTYNYLYTSPTDGYKLSSSAPHSGTIRAEYNTHHKRFPTIVNLTGVILGHKSFDVEGSEEVLGETITTYTRTEVDAYSLWDLTVSQVFPKGLRLTLGVVNIFDFTSDYISFNTSTTPGRSAFMQCTYKF